MKSVKIVPIPQKMEKYYGSGTMLHPEVEMVRETVMTIPFGRITTIKLLTEKMAKDFDVDVACPMRTGNHLKQLSKESSVAHWDKSVPFWRVIRNDKRLVKLTDYSHWAAVLAQEGFELYHDKTGTIKIAFSTEQLYKFEML